MIQSSKTMIQMTVFILIVFILSFSLKNVLLNAFLANPGLNATIFVILFIGIVWHYCILNELRREIIWFNFLNHPKQGFRFPKAPKVLYPLANQLSKLKGDNFISQGDAFALLDSISSRLQERREISHYLTQLLVFLGLLGTFYGLIMTIHSISSVVSDMNINANDLLSMFDHIKVGLAKPLAGMATAFSASMFGLAGSLVLGFLDLLIGRSQTDFFNNMEEWMIGKTSSQSALANASDVNHIDTSIERWLPRVQDFMRLTTENMMLLQQNQKKLNIIQQQNKEDQQELQDILKKIENVLEEKSDDVGTSQILQQIERQLVSLREDIQQKNS